MAGYLTLGDIGTDSDWRGLCSSVMTIADSVDTIRLPCLVLCSFCVIDSSQFYSTVLCFDADIVSCQPLYAIYFLLPDFYMATSCDYEPSDL